MNSFDVLGNLSSGFRKSQRTFLRSVERISSGTKVNSAADNAAGLAISTRLDTQLIAAQTSIANSNDAISFFQTTDSVLHEKVTQLQRIRELTVQASSEILEDDDRVDIQTELDELVTLIQDDSFEYNQKQIFGSEFDFFVHDALESESLRINLRDLTNKTIGAQYKLTSNKNVDTSLALTNTSLKINGLSDEPITILASQAIDDQVSTKNAAGSAIAKAAALNKSLAPYSAHAFALENELKGNEVSVFTLDNDDHFNINGHKFSGFSTTKDDNDGKLREAINERSDETGVRAVLDENQKLVLIAEDGRNIDFSSVGKGQKLGILDGVYGSKIRLVTPEQYQLEFESTDTIKALGFSPETTLVDVDFTSNSGQPSLEGFASTGLWHLTQVDSVSQPDALWYADPAQGNYSVGATAGHVTTAQLDLSSMSTVKLDFNYSLDIEGNIDLGQGQPNYDLFHIQVSENGGAFQNLIGKDSLIIDGDFHNYSLDLSQFAGSSIQVRFNFDSIDGFLNETEGIMLDDVKIHGQLANLSMFVGIDHRHEIDTYSVLDSQTAKESLIQADGAIAQLTQVRSTLGSYQNQSEHHINNLQTFKVSMHKSKQQISDADLAVEVADMTRNQIIQQGSTSIMMMAKAAETFKLDLIQSSLL